MHRNTPKKRNMSFVVAVVAAVLLAVGSVSGLNNGLARTPPMGWMSWERFRCTVDCRAKPDECISQRLLNETAHRMASDGCGSPFPANRRPRS